MVDKLLHDFLMDCECHIDNEEGIVNGIINAHVYIPFAKIEEFVKILIHHEYLDDWCEFTDDVYLTRENICFTSLHEFVGNMGGNILDYKSCFPENQYNRVMRSLQDSEQ
jgi:hypothetical protein